MRVCKRIEWPVILLNRGAVLGKISADWNDIGYPPGPQASVRDLWAHKDLGNIAGSYSTEVSQPRRGDGPRHAEDRLRSQFKSASSYGATAGPTRGVFTGDASPMYSVSWLVAKVVTQRLPLASIAKANAS